MNPSSNRLSSDGGLWWLVLLAATLGCQAWGQTYRQYRPLELTFTAETECADPFDFEKANFVAVFKGPHGAPIEVPGFWDGGRTWRIRFAPTSAGEWSYSTRFSRANDRGLNLQQGTMKVGGPVPSNPLHRHGGFLKVSANHRYLTYTDGTPFFWLGDTWWAAPSANVPIENFKKMVDARLAQGYTVFQAHGHRSMVRSTNPALEIGAFEAIRTNAAAALQYWRDTDQYLAYADEQGMVGAIGFGGAWMFDDWPTHDLKRLWHYYLARYGAYSITFLITQEYNIGQGDLAKHLPKMLALGKFIKETDPYKRAMTAHPCSLSRDLGQARNEDWCDFIMTQAGHRYFLRGTNYLNLYRREPPKPLLEAEANYEGMTTTNFVVNADAIRRTAYTAVQFGGFGFTYGAQGLYAGVLDRKSPGPTAKWGPVLTWDEGLRLPGGAQLQHLRAAYESVDWWTLEPRPAALQPACDISVKANGVQTFVLYYQWKGKVPETVRLAGLPQDARYRGEWFDPRDGTKRPVAAALISGPEGLPLPPRPDTKDWLLILRRE